MGFTTEIDVWVASASIEGGVAVLEIDALPQERGDRFVTPPRPTLPIR